MEVEPGENEAKDDLTRMIEDFKSVWQLHDPHSLLFVKSFRLVAMLRELPEYMQVRMGLIEGGRRFRHSWHNPNDARSAMTQNTVSSIDMDPEERRRLVRGARPMLDYLPSVRQCAGSTT